MSSTSPIAYLKYNLKVLEKLIIDHLRACIIHRYVDFGCGSAILTSFIASRVRPKEVVCIDINDESLKEAKKQGFKTFKCDLNKDALPLSTNSVDLATAFEVIEHLWNKDLFLEEVYRVLKPGGIFIISTPNLASWINRVMLACSKLPLYYNVSLRYSIERPSYGHISLYTLSSLRKHMESVGFMIVNIQGFLTPCAYKNFLVEAISVLSARLRPSLATDVLLVAKKPKKEFQ